MISVIVYALLYIGTFTCIDAAELKSTSPLNHQDFTEMSSKLHDHVSDLGKGFEDAKEKLRETQNMQEYKNQVELFHDKAQKLVETIENVRGLHTDFQDSTQNFSLKNSLDNAKSLENSIKIEKNDKQLLEEKKGVELPFVDPVHKQDLQEFNKNLSDIFQSAKQIVQGSRSRENVVAGKDTVSQGVTLNVLMNSFKKMQDLSEMSRKNLQELEGGGLLAKEDQLKLIQWRIETALDPFFAKNEPLTVEQRNSLLKDLKQLADILVGLNIEPGEINNRITFAFENKKTFTGTDFANVLVKGEGFSTYIANEMQNHLLKTLDEQKIQKSLTIEQPAKISWARSLALKLKQQALSLKMSIEGALGFNEAASNTALVIADIYQELGDHIDQAKAHVESAQWVRRVQNQVDLVSERIQNALKIYNEKIKNDVAKSQKARNTIAQEIVVLYDIEARVLFKEDDPRTGQLQRLNLDKVNEYIKNNLAHMVTHLEELDLNQQEIKNYIDSLNLSDFKSYFVRINYEEPLIQAADYIKSKLKEKIKPI